MVETISYLSDDFVMINKANNDKTLGILNLDVRTRDIYKSLRNY